MCCLLGSLATLQLQGQGVAAVTSYGSQFTTFPVKEKLALIQENTVDKGEAPNEKDLDAAPPPPAGNLIDFTTDPNAVIGGTLSLVDLGNGVYGMVSGDYDGNGQVQASDLNDLRPAFGTAGYLPGDLDLNGQVQITDKQIFLAPNIGRGAQFNY